MMRIKCFLLMGFITGDMITNNLDTVFSFCPEERVYGTWQSYCNWENRARPSNFFQTQMAAMAQCSGIDMMDGSKPYETYGNTLKYPKSDLSAHDHACAARSTPWPAREGPGPQILILQMISMDFTLIYHLELHDLEGNWGFSIAVPEFQKGILYLLKFIKVIDISQAESFAAAGLEQLLRLALQLQRPEVPSGSGRSYF